MNLSDKARSGLPRGDLRLFFRSDPFAGIAGKWAPLRKLRGIVSLEKPHHSPTKPHRTIYQTGSSRSDILMYTKTGAVEF